MSILKVIPAYGRDYPTSKAVREAWMQGQDFRIADLFHPDDGRYVNREQVDGHLLIHARFRALTQLAVFRASVQPPKPRKSRATPGILLDPRTKPLLDELAALPAGLTRRALLQRWPLDGPSFLKHLMERKLITSVRLGDGCNPFSPGYPGYRIAPRGREYRLTGRLR